MAFANNAGQNVNIILADDHPVLRRGVKELLEEVNGWKVVGEAGDGEKAYLLANEYPDALLIIDIMMPKMNGFEVVEKLKINNLPNKVIFLTMHNNENIFNRAVDIGVMGYILKDSTDNEIIEAINNIINGKRYISPATLEFLIQRGIHNDNSEDLIGLSKLTITERKILTLISKNLSNKEIANSLFISVHTVERHRANICQKLELSGTNALLHFVIKNKDFF